jgi:hypothetical protein
VCESFYAYEKQGGVRGWGGLQKAPNISKYFLIIGDEGGEHSAIIGIYKGVDLIFAIIGI